MHSSDKKVTVLHVIDSLPREGAEMVIYDLIQRGDRNGFAYLVCALTRGGGVAEMLREIGIPVFILGRRSPFDLKNFMRLLRMIKQRQVRVIHTHLFSSHLWGGAAALFLPDRILFRTEHNMSEWKSRLRRFLDYLLAFRTERFIAVSEPVRRSLIACCRVPKEKVTVIENGLNRERLKRVVVPAGKLDELGIPPGSKVVGTVAALTPKKGHRYLLAAAERILGHRDDVYFMLLGDGELREELERFIMNRGLSGRVLLLGSRPDAVGIMSLLDVFVLSSIREGLSIALLEAMALKRAVVVTAAGGSVDLVENDVSGLLVPPRDVSALAEAIERVLDDPNLRERLGCRASSEVLSGYDMETMVRTYERHYQEACSRKKGPIPRTGS